MSDLERDLQALAVGLAYPPTPNLVPAITARLGAAPLRRGSRPRRVAVATALAVLLMAGVAVAAVPGIRHAVRDLFGLGTSVRIERVPKLPAPPPGPGPDLMLGRPTTLAAARAHVAFGVLAPARPPDRIYVAASPPGGQIAFVYRPRRGLPQAPGTGTGMLITEFPGRQPRAYIAKSLGPGTTVHQVMVGGSHGVWISGSPHYFAFVDARGRDHEQSLRLATNTLLWRRGALLLRLEANVSRATALRIARSLR
jgi:hypothetical protein